MLVAVRVLPRIGAVGEDSATDVATTVAVSVACAIESMMREAASRGTRAGSNP